MLTPSPDRYDVAVVGFGPTGQTLANLLGEAGLSVAVFDRELQPLALPRAVHFDGEVMRIFQSLGLADRLLPHIRPSGGMRYLAADGQQLLVRPPAAVGMHDWAENYMFHQPDLEAVLREGVRRYPKVEVFPGNDVTGVAHGAGGARLAVRDRTDERAWNVEADWIVGCDGARSVVRQEIGSEFHDLGLHQPWLVVDVVLTRDVALPDATTQYCDPQRPATYVKVTGRRRRWEIMLMPGDDPAAMTEPARVWQLLSRWVDPTEAVLVRSAIYTFHSLIAKTWRAGRLLIAGDSAHQTPPFLGQGMCAGIRDAANLAWKLAAVVRGAEPGLLDSYQSERLPHAENFIASAVELGNILQTTDPEVARGRDRSFAAGGPEIFVNLSPRLGPGFYVDTPAAGFVAPQIRLQNGDPLDARIGTRFAMLAAQGLKLGPAAEMLARLGVSIVGDPAVDEWLAGVPARFAILRPDRFIFAVGQSGAELPPFLELIKARVGARPSHLRTLAAGATGG